MKQDLKIGQIIIGPQVKDAIHCAIMPVVAAEKIPAGAHIGLSNDGKACRGTTHLGVADPFLKTKILAGDTFWMFMYPNTVANLRHEWDHPALAKIEKIKQKEKSQTSKEWLENYALYNVYSGRGYSEEQAYEALLSQVKGGDLTFYGKDCHDLCDVPDSDELFQHLSVVLNRQIGAENFSYFSCSC